MATMATDLTAPVVQSASMTALIMPSASTIRAANANSCLSRCAVFTTLCFSLILTRCTWRLLVRDTILSFCLEPRHKRSLILWRQLADLLSKLPDRLVRAAEGSLQGAK